MQAIVARELTRYFSPDIHAVDGIDLDVPEGQIFGFLGQNGSGKTTTVRMLVTLLKPTSGTASVAGLDIATQRRRIRQTVGVALQEVGLDELQTGREVLALQARLLGVPRGEAERRVADLLDVVTLTDAADRRISGYSGGMKRRLDLACALVHQPKVIFLDEPTTGLDPITRDAIWQYVLELRQRYGVTFFMTTQYLEEADRLADEIAIMDAGKIVASGTPAALKASIGTDTIHLTFENHEQAEAAHGVLLPLEGIEECVVMDRDAVLSLRDGAAAVTQIVRTLDQAGMTARELRLSHPTLDSVFIRATGRQLEVHEGPSRPERGER